MLFLFGMLYGQKADQIVLQNADIFAGKRLENGEDVRELTGNVQFKQGTTRVWCDKASAVSEPERSGIDRQREDHQRYRDADGEKRTILRQHETGGR
jgi:lipopolysaccharide export system protein LptA